MQKSPEEVYYDRNATHVMALFLLELTKLSNCRDEMKMIYLIGTIVCEFLHVLFRKAKYTSLNIAIDVKEID